MAEALLIALLPAALCTLACTSLALAQSTAPYSDPLLLIRAQIMQHWFPVQHVKKDFAVSFDLNKDGTLVGDPKVILRATYNGASPDEMVSAIKAAQPFLLLKPEDYDQWKHVSTTFTQSDKRGVDLYFFTKKDLLGISTRMTEPAAKAVLSQKECRVSMPAPQFLDCSFGNGSGLRIQLTSNFSPNVVTSVSYIFKSADPVTAVYESISRQFHTRPFNEVWYLSPFVKLQLTPVYAPGAPIQVWQLDMVEPDLFDRDREALAQKQREAAPTPKF